jgi:hypothetical protein
LLALGVAGLARADGEAGLVIDDGDSVRTFCVAFEGESISGEQLLRAAGLSFDQFGGSARVVCSIDGLGCNDASSFDGCFCQCRSGAGSCTYWAFFIQRHGGSWQYSTLGFNLAQARDGDLHAWRWGPGGGQSAPPPAATTFEQVCGHPPRGGSAQAPTATATPTSRSGPSPAPTAAPSGTSVAAASPTPTAVETATADAATTATGTATAAAATATATFASTAAAPTVTVTLAPAATDGEHRDEGPSVAAWAGFGAIAAVLLAGIAGGIAWRRRHGG